MTDKNPLMNIGDLAKPVDTLINRVSDAIGGFAKPWQIERVAKAEAKAQIILAASSLELPDVTKRALQRILIEETCKQINLEDIVMQATPLIDADASPEDIEEDWLTNFLEASRIVSNKELQIIWAKILAGEANSPGEFSKKTINILSSFEKEDAELFQILSNFFWTTSDFIFPYINIIDDEFYSSHGITYGNLLHLQSLGLVTFNSLGGYKIIKQPETKSLNYFNKKIELILNNDQNRELQLGQVLLTNVGIDLASVIKGNPIEDFFDFSLNKFMTDDISIVSPVFK